MKDQLKSIAILVGLVIVVLGTIKGFNYIQSLRVAAMKVNDVKIAYEEAKILLEQQYQDSLEVQWEEYLRWRAESDIRLANYKALLNAKYDDYNEELDNIYQFTTVDERIKALRTELSRKDIIPGRYSDMYDNRSD